MITFAKRRFSSRNSTRSVPFLKRVVGGRQRFARLENWNQRRRLFRICADDAEVRRSPVNKRWARDSQFVSIQTRTVYVRNIYYVVVYFAFQRYTERREFYRVSCNFSSRTEIGLGCWENRRHARFHRRPANDWVLGGPCVFGRRVFRPITFFCQRVFER